MSFSGQISSLPLGDVVQNLVANKKTGTLEVRSGGIVAWIQFSSGAIVSYRDDRGLDFARWLLDKELVVPEKIEQAVRRHKRAKRKTLGEILHDLGAMDLGDYKTLLRDVVREDLCEVLGFQEGSFTFRESILDDAQADREVRALEGGFPAQNLIMEAARRADEWQQIRRRLPAEDEIYSIAPSSREHLLESLAEEDEVTATALELLDGNHTIKQVIARLPCSRFDASHCISGLIAAKTARPLEAEDIVELSDGGQDSAESIAQLEAILAREPNNRDVHNRLAVLHEQRGESGDAAKHHKMLAVSYLEDGDIDAARSHLSMSLELNPRDIVTWKKLWSCVCDSGERDAILTFGREFLDHFVELGLTEIVRDHLLRLVEMFPDEHDFEIRLGEAYFDLGEQKKGTAHLSHVASVFVKIQRWDDAESVLQKIVKYDPSNDRARKRIDEIRSGRLERRRALYKNIVRQSIAAVFLVGCVWFIIREMLVQNELLVLMRTVFAEQIIEERRYDEAIERIEAVRAEFPWSPTASGQGAALVDSLEQKTAGVSAVAPGGARQSTSAQQPWTSRYRAARSPDPAAPQ